MFCLQDVQIPSAEKPAEDSSPTGAQAGTSDQAPERPPPRRTREQAAAGSRRLRSGTTIAEPGKLLSSGRGKHAVNHTEGIWKICIDWF